MSGERDWRELAACKGRTDIEWVPSGPDGINLARARVVCDSCPVHSECLGEALRDDVHGIWAGTRNRERRRLRAGLPVQPRRRPPAAVCGTDSGYYRHIRQLHEPACDGCLAAHSAAESRRNKRSRAS